jgi:hypothetical protein
MQKVFQLLTALLLTMAISAQAAGCRDIVHELNRSLPAKVDEAELAEALQALNASRNQRLPDRYVTKREAQQAGWHPGRDLWQVPALRGHSIGGDRFGNREGRLPPGDWREADLDYRGGHRGAKRLLFSRQGQRRVTVDHYQTFIEVPPCQ